MSALSSSDFFTACLENLGRLSPLVASLARARASRNGKARQKGKYSRHERRQLTGDALDLVERMAITRRQMALDQLVGR